MRGASYSMLALLHYVRICARVAALLIVSLLCGSGAIGEQASRNVLLLYPYDNTQPSLNIPGGAIRKRLLEVDGKGTVVHAAFLDLTNFGRPQDLDQTARLLGEKYRDTRFSVVMPLGTDALRFTLRYRPQLAANVPVVFCCVAKSLLDRVSPLPEDVTGAVTEADVGPAADLAIRLQPMLKRIILVNGASTIDNQWLDIFRHQLEPFASRFEVVHLANMPIDEIRQRVSELSSDSAVIFGLMFADSTGRQFTTAEAQDIITDASSVPVYIHADTQLGRGALGGFVGTLESAGTSAADLSLEVMRGANPASLPLRGAQEVSFRVDARALKRWGIPEDRLPPDSIVLYREPTLWQLYRNQVIAALAVIALQSLLLIALTIQIFRRRRAEAALRSATGELARVSRITTMGEMAASIAHEVNQPLTAIVAYARAGLRWLGHANPNLEEARANFDRISRDGLRAADIITTVRSMFGKQSGKMSELDPAELVSGVLALTHGEIVDSGAVLRTSYEADLPRIRGDKVQLQQVVLNLVTNAVEAMQPMPSDRRKLSVSITRSGENMIALDIADGGPGIPAEALERIFDSFYTTKQKGLGMGLSICRSIIQQHNGTLMVVDTGALGTRFRVTLPVDETS